MDTIGHQLGGIMPVCGFIFLISLGALWDKYVTPLTVWGKTFFIITHFGSSIIGLPLLWLDRINQAGLLLDPNPTLSWGGTVFIIFVLLESGTLLFTYNTDGG